MDRAMVIAVLLVGCEACVREGVPPPEPPSVPSSGEGIGPGSSGSGGGAASGASRVEASPSAPSALVTRAELEAMDARECHAFVRERGGRFEVIPEADARGVIAPIRLSGPLGGVTIEHGGRSRMHEIMSCKLTVSLLGWAPALRAAGFDRIEHASIYRPGARVRSTGRQSGHAGGGAIDAFHFIRPDGTRLEVERDWADKTIGAPVCPPRQGEPEAQHVLRTLVCDAVAADLFQVVVTPHGDRHHHNHVHLEVRPDVDWTHVR